LKQLKDKYYKLKWSLLSREIKDKTSFNHKLTFNFNFVI
jgi:hypothetical protein